MEAGSLWPAILVALFGFGVAAYAVYAPPSRGEMAVVFSPGTDAKAAYFAILLPVAGLSRRRGSTMSLLPTPSTTISRTGFAVLVVCLLLRLMVFVSQPI